jgi:phosphoribosyl 1,2-cyclic phosphodiesterase
MRIKVIGSGSDGNCYKVTDGKTMILLDAGLPIKTISKALKYKLTSVSGVFVTHEHLDHAKSARDMANKSIDIFMSPGTQNALSLYGHRIHTVKEKQVITCGTFVVIPFNVHHDSAEPLGYVVYSKETNESILYLTDAMYCDYYFNDINYFLVEANFDYEIMCTNDCETNLATRIMNSHMSVFSTSVFLSKCDLSNTKRIYLIHLSNNNSNKEMFKQTIEAIVPKECEVIAI